MTKTIVITSGKGGVGKTNISVSTALELSNRGYRTCLFDADFGLANVDILLGLRPELTLDDFIFGDKKLKDIILHSKTGIDIIPGSSGIEKIANLAPDKIASLVSSFSELADYDYFLIDTSSGISKGVISFCLASTETIVVITSESTSLIDAYGLVKVMATNGYTGTVKILVNKCPDVPTSKRTYLRFKNAVNNHLDVNIAPVGIILNDPNFETALKHQEPLLTLYPNSIGSQCIRSMVSILLHSTTGDKTADFSEFWKRYFDFSATSLSIPKDTQGKGAPIESPVTLAPDENQLSPLPSTEPEKAEEKNLESLLLTDETTEDSEENVPAQAEPARDKESDNIPKAAGTVIHDDSTVDTLHLPSPIPLLSSCLELQSRGALSQNELFEAFTCDPALLVKALRMRSASIPRGPKRITSIHQILHEIGGETLTSLLNKAIMQEALADSTETDTDFVNMFWHHSYKTAVIARNIATATKYPYPEEAFLAALIHDIGRLALQNSYPEVYKQSALTFTPEEPLLDAEKRAFGANHAEKGAASVRNLHLNSFIADAVQYHTEPESTIKTAFDLVKIVSVASRLAEPTQENEEHGKCLGTLEQELSSTQLKACMTEACEEVEQTATRFQIPLTKESDKKSVENERILFKRLAVDYTLLQEVLPTPVPTRDLAQIIRRIHQGLNVLFGIKRTLCLIPDEHSSYLQAVGYPDCFGWEILSDIFLSFESAKSVIIEAFSHNEMQIVLGDETTRTISLGDQQIIRYLDSDGLTCVPMVVNGESVGVIIFGIKQEEQTRVRELQGKLQQFAAQSARNVIALEQVAQKRDTTNTPPPEEKKDVRDNLFN